jgi:hypothetical protein
MTRAPLGKSVQMSEQRDTRSRFFSPKLSRFLGREFQDLLTQTSLFSSIRYCTMRELSFLSLINGTEFGYKKQGTVTMYSTACIDVVMSKGQTIDRQISFQSISSNQLLAEIPERAFSPLLPFLGQVSCHKSWLTDEGRTRLAKKRKRLNACSSHKHYWLAVNKKRLLLTRF